MTDYRSDDGAWVLWQPGHAVPELLACMLLSLVVSGTMPPGLTPRIDACVSGTIARLWWAVVRPVVCVHAQAGDDQNCPYHPKRDDGNNNSRNLVLKLVQFCTRPGIRELGSPVV